MLDIKGKIALITGGASGIGLICAEELLRNGCRGVTIVDLNERKGVLEKNNLNNKYGDGKVIFVKANVVNKIELEEAFKETIKAFKHLDIVFNNAGLINEIDYEISLDVNVKGVFHCLKLAIDEYLPKYKSGPEAVIINTASLAGLILCQGVELYSTTKFAVVALTRNYGIDFHYKRSGVRVVAICPNATDSAFFTDFNAKLYYKELIPVLTESYLGNKQTLEELSKSWIKLVENADNGSIWYVGKEGEKKIDFPDLITL